MITRQSYIVAATPRTGSSLLCEGLEATGIAGCPAEVFAPDFRGRWYKYWLLSQSASFSDYLDAAFRHGTTNNGMYGLKIQWMHIAVLARKLSFVGNSDDVLESLFPDAAFVNIVRRDRRAQALSWFRAITTNEWWRFKGDQKTPIEPIFDGDTVRTLEAEIMQQQSAWEQYFLKRRIEPLVIEYEELSRDYQGQVARVLAFLHLNVSAAYLIPPPRLVRQSDDLTLRWRRLMEATLSQEVESDEAAP